MQKYEQRDRNPSTEGELKRWKTECFAKQFTSYSIGNGNSEKCGVLTTGGFPAGLAVKKPPAIQETQETQIQSLGR